VGALAQPVRRSGARIFETPHGVGPRPGRVDDRSGRYRDAADFRAGDPPAGQSESRHLGVVQDGRAAVGGGADVGEAEAAVIRPRVGIEAAAAEPFEPKIGNASPRPLRRHQAADPLAREGGVEPQGGLDRRRAIRPPAVERQQERHPPYEVRRHDREESPPLGMGLANKADISEPEVAEPAVDELRRGARGRAPEVAAIHERDREPGPSRLGGDPGADDPSADHEQVEPA
jgi:hypothetical protein